MKEELFNNETKRKAGQQGREESQHPVYQRQTRQLGLYDVENEHDACGVGMLVNIHGGKSHELVESALKVLENMRHRGAEGADNKTGDGAGILLQIPHEFILLQGIPVPYLLLRQYPFTFYLAPFYPNAPLLKIETEGEAH